MLVDTTVLRHDAHRLRERAGLLRTHAHGLPGEAPPSWKGAAGEAFADALRRRRDDLDHAAMLHEVAARVLEAHLDAVDAQQAVQRAVADAALGAGQHLLDAAVDTAGDAAIGVVSGLAGALR